MSMAVPKIISRKEAMARGLKWYFTGKPCKYGHILKRSTRYKRCSRCHSIEQKRSYIKAISQGGEQFRQQHNKKNREWLAKNPEYPREWRAKNLEHHKEKCREYKMYGPKNPTGELQWLRKALAFNRQVKRMLRSPQNAWKLPSKVSPQQNSTRR